MKRNNINNSYIVNNNKIRLNAIKKLPKKITFSSINNKENQILNKLNHNFSSCRNKNNNKNIKYLNYRSKLLNKCNYKIFNNKLFPILTNTHSYNYNNDKTNIKNIPLNQISYSIEKINISQINKNKKSSIHDKKQSFASKNNKESSIEKKLIENDQHLNNLEKNGQNINIAISSNLKDLNEKDNINKNNENETKENKNFEITHENNELNEKLFKDLIPKKNAYKYRPFKFSKFYKLSKKRNVSARNIYEYYISEEIKDNKIFDPIDNFTKFIEKKYKNPNKKFNKLYGFNKPYLVRLQEIKNNNSIAYKEDFDLKEYQNILCGMIRKRVRNDNIYILKEDFKKFNEKLEKGFLSYKGRFTQLAEKIRYNAPSYLVDKLKKLDEDKLKAKARYFKIKLNKKKDNDIEFVLDDFNFYMDNKFIPNEDIK